MASLYRGFILIAVVVAFICPAWALSAEYCSDLNTASTGKNSSIYQSNGLCYNFCLEDYAFAVLQDDGCWCTDYAPGTTVSTSKCNLACPGFPSDLCGAAGLYGYLALTIAPSGTQGASTSAAASTPVADTSTSTSTTVAAQAVTTAKKVTSTTADPTTDTSTTSTWTPTPVVSLETVTGQVRTVTVIPTSPPSSSSATTTTSRKSTGLSTGAAVGLTVGLVALAGLIAAIIFFYIRRKRKDEEAEKNAAAIASLDHERQDSGGAGSGGVKRTMSENSRYMLGTDGRQVVEGWDNSEPGTRRSRLIPIDPRLDPFSGVYSHENKSRESVNTIRDNQDYSRRFHQQKPILRATNPDSDED